MSEISGEAIHTDNKTKDEEEEEEELVIFFFFKYIFRPRDREFDPRSDPTFQELSNYLGMTLQRFLE